eukprot:PhF_6_TR40047/c0_g2_i1/m.59418
MKRFSFSIILVTLLTVLFSAVKASGCDVSSLVSSCLVVNVSDVPSLITEIGGDYPTPSRNNTRDLVLWITLPMNYEYTRESTEITLRRPDVASVTIQCCGSDVVEWRCGGG